MRRYLSGIAAAALALGAGAWAQPSGAPADLAAAFGARPSVEDISLSPDGAKVAYIAPRSGQASSLYTVALGGGEPRIAASADGDPQRLYECDWISNRRLACQIYGVMQTAEARPLLASRLVAVDEDGKNIISLSQRDSVDQWYGNTYGGQIIDLLPGDDNAVLMDRWFVPEVERKTRLNNKEEGLGVVRVDTRNHGTQKIEDPDSDRVEYITDGRGRVRIMGVQLAKGASGYSGSKVNYSYRTADSRQWRPLGSYDVLTEEGVNPYAIDPKLNVVYAMKKQGGRQAVYRIALDGTLREELVFAHGEVDADDIIRIGRSRRPVGVRYVTDKADVVYFDPELKALAAALGRSLPNLPLVAFVDSNEDESKLLVWAGSDVDPGRYYLFDKARKQLNEILLARPQLEGMKLAPVKAVSYRAADGTMVPAYLTLPVGGAQKGLPALVMPHGGPSARDEWGFDWLPQYFAAKGYAVLQPNYRGSSGYGDAWFRQNGFRSWRTAIGDVNDAGRWLVSEGIADPSKLGIFGWSYGGYAALQSSVVDPNLFKAIVAVAPATDLELLKEESRGWSNHALAAAYIGSGPHIEQGSPARNAASIKAPVLMFHGTLDRNVGIAQAQRMESRLKSAGKRAELVVYPKLDHYLDDSRARADMLRKSDAFLRSVMGM